MTTEEILEIARQAGAHDNGYEVQFVEPKYLERFAKLVAEKEREACAKIVERNYSEIIADKIRARGQE
jgi:DNA-directed RNA polymerase subunit F